MKNLICSIFCGMIFWGCSTTKKIDLLSDEKYEIGKCYYSILTVNEKNNTNPTSSFVLEIEPPKFKIVKKIYSKKELEKSNYYIQTKPTHFNYLFKNEALIQKASILQSKGEVEEAIKLLAQVEDTNENSQFVSDSKKYIRLLKLNKQQQQQQDGAAASQEKSTEAGS